jgi:hypothetical protein
MPHSAIGGPQPVSYRQPAKEFAFKGCNRVLDGFVHSPVRAPLAEHVVGLPCYGHIRVDYFV